jgi:tetratricopeptide (TPR) repeat protein
MVPLRARIQIAALGGIFLVFAGVVARAADGMTPEAFVEWNFFNNLGWEALNRGDYEAAAKRFRHAIELARPGSETNPRLLARSYADLAIVLYKQGRSSQAEPLAEWALAVREKHFPEKSIPVAQSLYWLALIEHDQAKLTEAEGHFVRAVSCWEKVLGPDHGDVVPYRNDLALFYMSQRKYDHAEPLYQRSLDLPLKKLSADHSDRLTSLVGLANAYNAQGKHSEAERLYRKAIEKLESLPNEERRLAETLENLAAMLRQNNRTPEAESLEAQAKKVRKEVEAPRPTKPVARRSASSAAVAPNR